MNFKNSVRGLTTALTAALALGGCNKPAAPVEAPVATPSVAAPVADSWTLSSAPASATRTVTLLGGGELGMVLSCDFRSSTDSSANGFWLKLALELKSADGALGLDPLTTELQNARFSVIRSTGEAGSILLTITDPTHFVYENNQTNDFSQNNNDPAKVELAQKFDLPLSDGRVVAVDMLKSDAGYKAVLTQCVTLAPK